MVNEKIKILFNNNVISQKTYDYVVSTYLKLKNLNFNHSEVLLLHLAMALNRIEQGKDSDPMPSVVKEQLYANKNIENAKKLYENLFADNKLISKNERDYLVLHLSTLLTSI